MGRKSRAKLSKHAKRLAQQKKRRLARSLPQRVEIVEYRITDEPDDIADNYGLSEDEAEWVADLSQEFHALPHSQRGSLIPRLEAAKDRFPQIPMLWNHVAAAYDAAGRDDDHRRTVLEVLERFPNYLFGKLSYAEMLLHDGRLDEFAEFFGGRFALHDCCNGRCDFHLSEMVSFFGLMVQYFLKRRDFDQAERYLESLNTMAPDHPTTQALARKFFF